MPRDAVAPDELNIQGALEWAHARKQDELVARICVGMQAFWRDYGRGGARERYLPWGLAAAQRVVRHDRAGQAPELLALLKLGNAQWLRLQGQLRRAERISHDILPMFGEFENRQGLGSALVLVGNIARDRGTPDVAEQRYKDALDVFSQLDDKVNLGLALSFLGQVTQRRGTRSAGRGRLSATCARYL